MKRAVFLILCICTSCKHVQTGFVQNDLIVASPVRQVITADGKIVETSFSDGGTKMVRIIDAKDRSFSLFIDHRIGKENEWGTLYINGYPESPGSIRILDPDKFKKCFVFDLKY